VSTLHHYVPQWYLKGFCDPWTPNGQEPFLWVRGTGETVVKRRAPKNLAAENGYYVVLGPTGTRPRKSFRPLKAGLETRCGATFADPWVPAVKFREIWESFWDGLAPEYQHFVESSRTDGQTLY